MDASPPRHPKAPPLPAAPGVSVETEETVYAGRFAMQRIRFRYTRFDGRPSGLLTWELWRRGGGVLVLPYDPASDRVALVEQFRLPALAAGLRPVQTEAPAGLLEPGEDPAEAGGRELLEESGLVARRMERIGGFLLMPGGCDEVLHHYCAQVDLAETAAAHHGLAHEGEDTRVLILDAEDAFRMVAEDRVQGAPTALALLWLQANRARLRAEWI
jgi:ADP-ribose pyrophosphatase